MTSTTLGDRAVLRLSGDDVRGFLQGLVTNDVRGDLPIWTALLTPQGKALFDFLIWSRGDDLLIDCEASRADALAKRLAIYRLRRSIVIERLDDVAVHWLRDTLPVENRDGAVRDGVSRPMALDPRHPELGCRWLGPPSEGFADEAWQAHRLSLGVTEGADELGDGDTLWLECNARELNGVSFAKGCYIGQENTARMHHRAKISRRLVVVPEPSASERTRVRYPSLGLAVELRRVNALDGALVPAWLADALANVHEQTAS